MDLLFLIFYRFFRYVPYKHIETTIEYLKTCQHYKKDNEIDIINSNNSTSICYQLLFLYLSIKPNENNNNRLYNHPYELNTSNSIFSINIYLHKNLSAIRQKNKKIFEKSSSWY